MMGVWKSNWTRSIYIIEVMMRAKWMKRLHFLCSHLGGEVQERQLFISWCDEGFVLKKILVHYGGFRKKRIYSIVHFWNNDQENYFVEATVFKSSFWESLETKTHPCSLLRIIHLNRYNLQVGLNCWYYEYSDGMHGPPLHEHINLENVYEIVTKSHKINNI